MLLIKICREIYYGRGNSAATIQSLLTKFLILALNAGTSLVVARILGPKGRGEMSALIVWSGFLSGLLTFGLPSALIFNLRLTPELRSRIVGTTLVLTLILSALVGLTGFIALPFWLTNYSAHDITLARWFLFSSPITLFLLIGRASVEASGRFSHSNFALWAGPFLTLVLLACFALAGRLSPLTAGLCYVLGNVPGTLWVVVSAWREYSPTLRSFGSTTSRLLHYGLRSWGVDLLNALSAQADQVLIVKFLSPTAMGTYIVAAGLARFIGVFQSSTAMVLFPRIAARDKIEVVSLTSLATRVASFFATFTALTLGFAGPYLLGLLYGRVYVQEGTIVFRILLADAVLSGATQMLASAFMACGRPGVVTVIQTVGVGLGIASMPFLILKFGVAGAAMALIMSSSIRLVLTLSCFRTVLHVPAPSLLPKRSDLGFVLARIRSLLPSPELVAVN